jgi:lysophospholipase L1-like esterase
MVCDYACATLHKKAAAKLVDYHNPIEGTTFSYDNTTNILQVYGKSAHGSTPQLGANALQALLCFLGFINDDCQNAYDLLFNDGLGLSVYEDETGKTTISPDVATFENGILTAVGVGETTVTASYGDQEITVSVKCLAETEEELLALEEAVLRTAKRYPPVMGDEPMDYFADAAVVGDSISYILFQWETMYNYMGDVLFLVRGGTGLNGIVRDYKRILYKGRESKLDDAIIDAQPNKVFIMLGQNDLRYREIEDCMESWVLLIERIRSAKPEIEIHIQSCTPEWIKSTSSNFNNEKIEEYNEILRQFAADNDCFFVDIHYYTVDHLHRMPTAYELDKSIHMNEAGCYAWIQALKAYAFLQQ